jgi:hypothetical protein
MTSPSSMDPHAAVWVADAVLAHLQRNPGRSHAQRVLPCGRALYPVRVALLAVAYFGAAKVGLTMVAVSQFVFAGPTALISFHPLASTVFPLVIWAALRFGQPAATRMTFGNSSMAVWGTVRGSIRTIGVAGKKNSLRAHAPRPLFRFYL